MDFGVQISTNTATFQTHSQLFNLMEDFFLEDSLQSLGKVNIMLLLQMTKHSSSLYQIPTPFNPLNFLLYIHNLPFIYMVDIVLHLVVHMIYTFVEIQIPTILHTPISLMPSRIPPPKETCFSQIQKISKQKKLKCIL